MYFLDTAEGTLWILNIKGSENVTGRLFQITTISWILLRNRIQIIKGNLSYSSSITRCFYVIDSPADRISFLALRIWINLNNLIECFQISWQSSASVIQNLMGINHITINHITTSINWRPNRGTAGSNHSSKASNYLKELNHSSVRWMTNTQTCDWVAGSYGNTCILKQ